MRQLTQDETLLLNRAKIIRQAKYTEFWTVLREFCRETADMAVTLGFQQPANSAMYVGSARTALDIFDRLSELPAQAEALQAQLALEAEAEQEAAVTPKPSRRYQPVSAI